MAMLGPGDFLGEGCLAAQPLRMGTANAVMPTALLRVPKRDMIRMLHEHPEFSDRFLAHMLTRNIRIEEDLIDRLLQFQREAACPYAAAPRPIREGRDAARPAEAFHRRPRRRPVSRPARHGKESFGPSHRTGRHSAGLSRRLSRGAHPPRGTRRRDARRHAEGLSRRSRDRARC